MYSHKIEAGHAVPARTAARAVLGERACWYWAALLSNGMHQCWSGSEKLIIHRQLGYAHLPKQMCSEQAAGTTALCGQQLKVWANFISTGEADLLQQHGQEGTNAGSRALVSQGLPASCSSYHATPHLLPDSLPCWQRPLLAGCLLKQGQGNDSPALRQ